MSVDLLILDSLTICVCEWSISRIIAWSSCPVLNLGGQSSQKFGWVTGRSIDRVIVIRSIRA